MQSNTTDNDNTISIVNFNTNKNCIENIDLEIENDNKNNDVRDNITKVVAKSININFEKDAMMKFISNIPSRPIKTS